MHYKKYAQLPHEEKWYGFTLDYKYIEGFSPLFYETNGTHWDLDHDADNFLLHVMENYWLNDFMSPETYYLNALIRGADFVEQKSHEFVENSEYFNTKSVDDELNSVMSRHRRDHPDEIELSRLIAVKTDIVDRIYKFIPSLLREIINSNYTYSGLIDKQDEHEDTPYNHAIIREPGKYLYHYFNDQMVFDNYVQYITTPRLDPEVVALLDSGVLLEPIVRDKFWTRDLDEIIEVVADNYRGWWT